MDSDGEVKERTQAYADDRNADANGEFNCQFLALLEMATRHEMSESAAILELFEFEFVVVPGQEWIRQRKFLKS